MKIQLKRSNVLLDGNAKPPSPAQTEYGELSVNYNASDPTIFIKDSNNNIIPIAGGPYSVTIDQFLAAALWQESSNYVYTKDLSQNVGIGGSIGSYSTTLDANGDAEFGGTIISGDNALNGSNAGVTISPTGNVSVAQVSSGSTVWAGHTAGSSTKTSLIRADGSAEFSGGKIKLNLDGTIDVSGGITNNGIFKATSIESGGDIKANVDGLIDDAESLYSATNSSGGLVFNIYGNGKTQLGHLTASTVDDYTLYVTSNSATLGGLHVQNLNSAGKLWAGVNATGSTTSNIYADGQASFYGNVGIGAEYDAAFGLNLQFAGETCALFKSTTDNKCFLRFSNTADSLGYIGYINDQFIFYAGNNEVVNFTKDGNVGIGLSTPQYLLHATSDGNGRKIGAFNSLNTTTGVYLGCQTDAAFVDSDSIDALALRSNGTERMRVNATGASVNSGAILLNSTGSIETTGAIKSTGANSVTCFESYSSTLSQTTVDIKADGTATFTGEVTVGSLNLGTGSIGSDGALTADTVTANDGTFTDLTVSNDASVGNDLTVSGSLNITHVNIEALSPLPIP